MARAGRWLLLSLPPMTAALIVWFGAVVLPMAAGTFGMNGRWVFAALRIVIGPVALGIPIAVALSIVENVIGQRGRMNVRLVTIELICIYLAWGRTWMALDLGWS